jgi:hypothetical protein
MASGARFRKSIERVKKLLHRLGHAGKHPLTSDGNAGRKAK